MNISRRVAISLFLAAIILLAVLLFWPFVLNDVLKPIAMVAWLFLRIFVLSIGQRYYWIAIIFVALVFLYRFLSQSKIPLPAEESFHSNEILNTIQYWRIRFSLTDNSNRQEKSLKRELVDLLVSLYAAKQRGASNYAIRSAMERSQIPLPENIHTFLFPEERQESRSFLRKLIQSIPKTPRKWIRQWTGKETAERYRMIEEVLSFLETALEIKNDARKSIPNED
jgi:hypothetical protein